MVIGILQPSYFPWLGYIEQIVKSDVFVLYDNVQYDKNGWRNRNRIKIPGRAHWLTVPVRTSGKNFPLLSETLIDNSQPWARSHLQTIKQYYSKASFFNQYFPPLHDLLSRPWVGLAQLNYAIITWLCEVLHINTTLCLSSELAVSGDRLDRLVAIIKRLGGDTFYEGAAGQNYIPVEFFSRHDVKVVFQNYQHPVYHQLHGDFISHLSVLDLLFNVGPESLNVILTDSSC